MPDSRARDPRPSDWSEAFGALPLESPPEGGWQRLATALPPARTATHPKRWRRPALALAATAFFAAVIPLMQWRAVQTTPSPLHRPLDSVAITNTPASVPAPIAETPAPARFDASATPAPPKIAHVQGERRAVAAVTRNAVPAPLDALYTESARLEAVLAQLPDNVTGNVAALAVSAELQEQVTHIDLALSQPALPDVTRTALWEQRVDTLRQLTGVEATQRWQVALNDNPDAAIY